MSGTEALIDRLVAVDQFIDQGLAGFDRLMARLNAEEMEKLAHKAKRDDLGEDAIAVFAQQREAATAQARDELVEELTARAFDMYLADDLPGSVISDFRIAGAVIRGSLAGTGAALPFSSADRRREVHRNLWRAALRNMTVRRAVQ